MAGDSALTSISVDAAKGGTVVVAEDHDDTRALLEVGLELHGYTVVTAANGKDAVALVETHRPKAVIADLRMPNGSGFDVATEIRRRFGPDIRLIALTALPPRDAWPRAMKAGFDYYLVKPISADYLVQYIDGADATARGNGAAPHTPLSRIQHAPRSGGFPRRDSHDETPMLFSRLKKIQEFERRKLKPLQTVADFHLVCAVGYYQEQGQPLSVKQLHMLNLASMAIVRRRLGRLRRLGLITTRRSDSDGRSVVLMISPRLLKLYSGYGELLGVASGNTRSS